MTAAEDDLFTPTPDAAWTLRETGFIPADAASRAARFSISNGFIGVRATPLRERVHPEARTYVAGLFDHAEKAGGPFLVQGPDWLRVRLQVDGAELQIRDDDAAFEMVLDLARGALLSDVRLGVDERRGLRSRSLRFASLVARPLAMQLLELTPEGGEMEIAMAAEWGVAPSLQCLDEAHDRALWRTHDGRFQLAAVFSSELWVGGACIPPETERPCRAAWRWRARPGERAFLAHAMSAARLGAADEDASQDLAAHLHGIPHRGWTAALLAHEAAWRRRWRDSDVQIEGDAAAQRDLRFALYHLIGAANAEDGRVSVAARGLTGDDYKGHVFWDTETYLLPVYVLTDPPSARALLMYRFHTLDTARAKAKRLGYRGALYAWESAATGDECTPEYGTGPDGKTVEILAGKQEQHISADIARAVWTYWLATEDDGFLLQAGAEIVLETARFWASRATPEADGRRHIRGVIGPDEYHEDIDDNAYTNVLARWNIAQALQIVDMLRERWPQRWKALSEQLALGDDELAAWRDAQAGIVTGFDGATGLYEQFAGYFGLEFIDLGAFQGKRQPMDVVLGRERTERSQVAKQADVVALQAVLPEAFTPRSAVANFHYYEARCGHGSSLSRVTHGLVAAKLGEAEKALQYFRDAAAIDLADSQGEIGGGVHIAGLGGLWMTAVYGFGGLSVTANGVALAPCLPSAWSSLAFRFQWRGRRVRVVIQERGAAVEAALEAGEAMSVALHGRTYALRPGRPLQMGPARDDA
ncbi:MAG: glycoside hydrolase family 65 protein [Caulobacteraceae bacterium]|nr:glycoside hydrolase family 65 protein [Caulobacteraceae bacterium]